MYYDLAGNSTGSSASGKERHDDLNTYCVELGIVPPCGRWRTHRHCLSGSFCVLGDVNAAAAVWWFICTAKDEEATADVPLRHGDAHDVVPALHREARECLGDARWLKVHHHHVGM